MAIEKTEKAIWKMEKEGEMQVPAYIVANEKLFEKMKQDRTMGQLRNVAGLKGIIKKASLMPDGHEGYGFPIGGVAAFDAETGLISPGGIGYDINCITGDVKISNEDGNRRIKDFLKKPYSVYTVDDRDIATINPSFFMQFKTNKKILKIKTECGNTIKATGDHPFFTDMGKINAKDLVIGNKLFMNECGFYYDQIDEIEDGYNEQIVYDFTIPKTHNFIANNFVVSNCGVRLLKTDLTVDEVRPKIRDLCEKLFVNVPSGVGSESKLRLSHEELDEAVTKGVNWAIGKGYGTKADAEHCEEYGCMKGADPSKVSPKAKKRGKSQFGTLGAGNHFLEIQEINETIDENVAKAFGLEKGKVAVMIHCGSRGFGHQICSDNIGALMNYAQKNKLWLPDRELVYAPIQSEEAQNYLAGMKCAVNFAFTNRHIIAHWVRETFDEIFGKGTGEKMPLLYDVAHNIAKFEEHMVDGEKRNLIVHRKGATRAFPAGRPELPESYRSIGQPVLIPGSMGTASYVLVGKEKGLEVCWGSTCHGAGRTMSRGQAIRSHNGKQLKHDLWNKNQIYVRATHPKVIAEEAPDAYKNVDDVVQSVADAGISDVVVKLKPIGVVKG